MLPPPDRVDRHGKLPVPCICGQAGRKRDPGAVRVPREVGGRAVLVDRRCPNEALSDTARSSWRHITPFGMPVVPPV